MLAPASPKDAPINTARSTLTFRSKFGDRKMGLMSLPVVKARSMVWSGDEATVRNVTVAKAFIRVVLAYAGYAPSSERSSAQMDDETDWKPLRPPPPPSYWPTWLISAASLVISIWLVKPVSLFEALHSIEALEQRLRATEISSVEPQTNGRPAAAPEARIDPPAVYRCSRPGAVTYADDSNCDGGKASPIAIDRSANIMKSTPVPAAQPRSARTLTRSTAFLAPANVGPRRRVNGPECQRLDRDVAELDEMARRPQSAGSMQWIREQRRRARDQQFEIKC